MPKTFCQLSLYQKSAFYKPTIDLFYSKKRIKKKKFRVKKPETWATQEEYNPQHINKSGPKISLATSVSLIKGIQNTFKCYFSILLMAFR